MAEILITSHEQFVENKSITHFTRNLAAFKIKTIVLNDLKYYNESLIDQLESLLKFGEKEIIITKKGPVYVFSIDF